MIQKIKQELKTFFKSPKDIITFFIPIIFAIVLLLPMPYTVTVGGGTLNVDKKISVENEYENKGSINSAYVKELNGTVLTYLMSKIITSYELNKIEDVTLEDETEEEYKFREKMYFNISTESAVKVAYESLGKDVEIKEEQIYVLHITSDSDTNLQVKDRIIKINGINLKSYNDVNDIISNTIGDEITLTVIRNKKEVKCYAKLTDSKMGIYVSSRYTFETDPKIDFSFSEKEVGPSGGLMMALSIYNKLVKEDITSGKKIVGTGTIDDTGNVGEIGGVSHKLKGAVNSKADIFICPKENYEEARNLKEKNNYKIKVYGVSTFEEALEVLKSIE